MPSEVDKQISIDSNDPVKHSISVLETKVHNLARRMENINSRRGHWTKGNASNEDQEITIAKYEQETELLEIARDLQKELQNMKRYCSKAVVKIPYQEKLKRKQRERHRMTQTFDSQELFDNSTVTDETKMKQTFSLNGNMEISRNDVPTPVEERIPQHQNLSLPIMQPYTTQMNFAEQGKTSEPELALLKLFNSGQNFDVNFRIKCGQSWTTFSAHKLVLSIWSPFFADILMHEDDIEVTDILPTSFEAFLKFMYGSMEKIKENASNVKFILDLHKAAEVYQVAKLKEVCCGVLNSLVVNEESVFELLDVAILTNLECLKLRCIKVLQARTAKVFASCDIKSVTTSMIKTVLTSPILSLSSECDLLAWVYDWAESEYKRLSPIFDDPMLKQGIIQPFLPYFNFLLLEAKEFATLVSNHKEFFDERECFSILMNILCPGSVSLPFWYKSGTITRLYETYRTHINIDSTNNKHEPSFSAPNESSQYSSRDSSVNVLTTTSTNMSDSIGHKAGNLNGFENKESVRCLGTLNSMVQNFSSYSTDVMPPVISASVNEPVVEVSSMVDSSYNKESVSKITVASKVQPSSCNPSNSDIPSASVSDALVEVATRIDSSLKESVSELTVPSKIQYSSSNTSNSVIILDASSSANEPMVEVTSRLDGICDKKINS